MPPIPINMSYFWTPMQTPVLRLAQLVTQMAPRWEDPTAGPSVGLSAAGKPPPPPFSLTPPPQPHTLPPQSPTHLSPRWPRCSGGRCSRCVWGAPGWCCHQRAALGGHGGAHISSLWDPPDAPPYPPLLHPSMPQGWAGDGYGAGHRAGAWAGGSWGWGGHLRGGEGVPGSWGGGHLGVGGGHTGVGGKGDTLGVQQDAWD